MHGSEALGHFVIMDRLAMFHGPRSLWQSLLNGVTGIVQTIASLSAINPNICNEYQLLEWLMAIVSPTFVPTTLLECMGSC